VQDAGAGIAPELLARVFEPFVQGTAPAKRPQSGLGIGLHWSGDWRACTAARLL